MRLLDLVEQDDRVRAAADCLGELAALLVAHIAGRRTDELGDSYWLPNSDISKLMSASLLPNRYSASVLASSVLPVPVGPRKMNEPIGLRGSFSPARERRTASEMAAMACSCR